MNRRGFLASALAAPIAAIMGWKQKPRFDRIWPMIDAYRDRPTATGIATTREWAKTVGSIDYENMTDLMGELAEEAGKSHAQVKAELASTAFKDSFWK